MLTPFLNIVYTEYWTRINFHSICDVTNSSKPLLLKSVFQWTHRLEEDFNGFIFVQILPKEIRHKLKEIVNLLNFYWLESFLMQCDVLYIHTEDSLKINRLWAVYNMFWVYQLRFCHLLSTLSHWPFATLSHMLKISCACCWVLTSSLFTYQSWMAPRGFVLRKPPETFPALGCWNKYVLLVSLLEPTQWLNRIIQTRSLGNRLLSQIH